MRLNYIRLMLIASGVIVLLLSCWHATNWSQVTNAQAIESPKRFRARDLGIKPGPYPPGKFNAITDVPDVRVGHATLVEGTKVRTGVTAIVPPGANWFKEKIPAAIHAGNGFGKIIGFTQVEELGLLETPVLLTNTLGVWQTADALVDYMLSLPGNEEVLSINPVVGETNDGYLNDIRGRHISKTLVEQALKEAKTGSIEEGSVGAGTGTIAFDWKGGIGTSSRVFPEDKGSYVIGVLVQTNFGGHLTIAGVRSGKNCNPPPIVL